MKPAGTRRRIMTNINARRLRRFALAVTYPRFGRASSSPSWRAMLLSLTVSASAAVASFGVTPFPTGRSGQTMSVFYELESGVFGRVTARFLPVFFASYKALSAPSIKVTKRSSRCGTVVAPPTLIVTTVPVEEAL